MRIIPSKKVCEEFYLTYELKGAQKGVNVLARYYKIRAPKIILNGRRVGNGDEASYRADHYVAYFTKRGLDKFNVLHEFYHHLVYINEWDMSEGKEEREANRYAKKVLKTAKMKLGNRI